MFSSIAPIATDFVVPITTASVYAVPAIEGAAYLLAIMVIGYIEPITTASVYAVPAGNTIYTTHNIPRCTYWYDTSGNKTHRSRSHAHQISISGSRFSG